MMTPVRSGAIAVVRSGLIGHGVTSVFVAAGHDMQLEERFRHIRRPA